MPRKKGSKNKANHKAGGDRKSQAFKGQNNRQSKHTFFAQRRRAGSGADKDTGATTYDDIGSVVNVKKPAFNSKKCNVMTTNCLVSHKTTADAQALHTTDTPCNDDTEGLESREESEELGGILEEQQLRHELKLLSEAQEKLRKIMNHPSMKNHATPDEEEDSQPDGYATDEEDNSADSQANSSKKKFYRMSSKPPPGSVVGEYLMETKNKILDGTLPGFKLNTGSHWVPPPSDAVSTGIGNRPVADRFYLGNVWIYVWMPLIQYSRLVNKFPCPFCSETQTESNGLHWRSMFWHDKRVFVLHQRYQCKNRNCKCSPQRKSRTFATIDPRLLSKLPTRVASRFEFITTPGGPGIHRSMMIQFANLCTKEVLFGAYTAMVNEMHRYNYAADTLAYYRELNDWDHNGIIGYDGSAKEPYSAFGDNGKHNGMRMTAGLLKSIFFTFMESMESYMQGCFQMNSDKIIVYDETFKFTKKVFTHTAARSRVQPYYCSATALNGNRTLALSRLKHTKSHKEMTYILQGMKEARKNAGAPCLEIVEIDNVKGDLSLFTQAFPDIMKGVAMPDPHPEVPSLTLQEGTDYIFFTTVEAVNNFVQSSLDQFDALAGLDVYYGCDTEKTRHSIKTSLLQLSFNTLPTMVLHLHKMRSFPTELKKLLESEKFVPCGRSISGDLNELQELGIMIPKAIELSNLARKLEPDKPTGLQDLSVRWCSLKILNKEWGQNADYEVEQLPQALIEYGATDAIISRMVAQKLLSLTADNESQLTEPSPALKTGATVDVTFRNKVVARGCILFAGNGKARGEIRKWGSTSLGPGKAKVRVDEILDPQFKPPFPLMSKANPELNWPKNATLGMLTSFYEHAEEPSIVIACRLSSLRILLSPEKDDKSLKPIPTGNYNSGSESNKRESIAPTQEANDGVEGKNKDESASEASNEFDFDFDYDEVPIESLQGGGDGSNIKVELDDSAEPSKSPAREDMFHQLDKLPLPRDCPVSPLVYQLLIMGSCIKNDCEEKSMLTVRRRKGITDFILDEYLNKEMYRLRIRAGRPEGTLHGANIRLVKDALRDDPMMQEYWTTKLEEYLEDFAVKAERGYFEDKPGIVRYRFIRTDADGLNIWARDDGSNHAEAYHQKLPSVIGPMGVGAKSAHFLLLNQSYRYLVNIYVNRLRQPAFGHPYNHIEDEIQHLINDIFGMHIWPHRQNRLEFEPTDFVSVGIGKTCVDKDCVEVGPPMKGMSIDLTFQAERMGVVIPPLEPSTPEEYKLFARLLRQNPSCGPKALKAMMRVFLQQSDGKHIFPKTVAQLQNHLSRFKRNALIRSCQMRLSRNVLNLKARFASEPRLKVPPKAHSIQLYAGSGRLKHFVPPHSAPFQLAEVRPQLQRTCAWSPICKCYANECGGWVRRSCQFYGQGNEEGQATLVELNSARALQQKLLGVTKQGKCGTQHGAACAWWPYCQLAASVCGGTKRDLCCVFGGSNPIFDVKPDLNSEYAKLARKKRRNAQKEQSKKERKRAKKKEQCSNYGDEDQLQETVHLRSLHGRGYAIVTPEDTRELLVHGKMINDAVVTAYMNLLSKTCLEANVVVRFVPSQFYPLLQDQSGQSGGWTKLQRWVRRTQSSPDGWDTAPCVLIPIFTGLNAGGHFSGVVIDNTAGVVVYQDSLCDSGEEVQRVFRDHSPLLQNADWLVSTSPIQGNGSNDCGIFVLVGFFAPFVRSLLQRQQQGLRRDWSSASTTLSGMTSMQWGIQARRHILKSIKLQTVDLDDPIIGAMTFRLDGRERDGKTRSHCFL